MIIYQIDRDKGYIKVGIESDDDLWVLAMVISEGDLVAAKTTRDVSIDGSSKRRMPMTLTIRVTGMEFQAFSGRLRIKGVIVHGPERYGLKGSYHTLSIDVGSVVEIWKAEERLSSWIINKLRSSTQKGRRAILVALDYDEYSIALIQGQGIRILAEGSFSGVSKRDHSSYTQFSSELEKLAESIVDSVSRYKPYAIVIGSPGDLKKRLRDMILERKIGGVGIYLDSVSIGGRPGIDELVRRGVVSEVLKHYSIIEAQSILDEFLKRASQEQEMVSSGLDSVEKASSIGAVDKLAVIDDLLRSDLETRRRIDEIIMNVEKNGGRVIIVSSESDVGSKIKMLGGVIAIHRFKVYHG